MIAINANWYKMECRLIITNMSIVTFVTDRFVTKFLEV